MSKPTYYYSNARVDVLNIVPEGSFRRILEIGGGNFPTLQMLRDKHQAEIWGTDVRVPGVPIDHFVLGSITARDTAEKLPTDFDLVLANDVIEHVEDTEAFFGVIQEKLRPGGVLVMSVPNIRQVRTAYKLFIRGTWPRDDAGLFDRTHLRWFCKKDVVALAQAAGFELEDWRGSGRLVPRLIAKTPLAEFLALQNLFVFRTVARPVNRLGGP